MFLSSQKTKVQEERVGDRGGCPWKEWTESKATPGPEDGNAEEVTDPLFKKKKCRCQQIQPTPLRVHVQVDEYRIWDNIQLTLLGTL